MPACLHLGPSAGPVPGTPLGGYPVRACLCIDTHRQGVGLYNLGLYAYKVLSRYLVSMPPAGGRGHCT